MEIKNAKNASIVMAFNLGNDFDHILYAVMKVHEPVDFNVDQFLRFIKMSDAYDVLSIDVISAIGMQMVASQPPMMMMPNNNPYAFGHFQISQAILMDNTQGLTWTEYHHILNNCIKSYADIENVIWFFSKESLHAYLSSQNAGFHQVVVGNHDILYPAWFEINPVATSSNGVYGQPRSGFTGQNNNAW